MQRPEFPCRRPRPPPVILFIGEVIICENYHFLVPFAKTNLSLVSPPPERSVADWLDTLPAQGRAAFSLAQLQAAFPKHSPDALRLALARLARQHQVISVHHGYYLLIPPPYRAKGIVPATLFLDGLMRHLGRPYYVGLLNAAALHGASHQQPQETFVVTTFPVMRPTAKRGLRIQYLSKETLPPDALLENRKVETGYLRVSSPALTAADLVQYQHRIGGLDRAATVLAELGEILPPDAFTPPLLQAVPAAVWQRLGYLLEVVLDQPAPAEALFTACAQAEMLFHRVALAPADPTVGHPVTSRWRIVPNISVEPDDL